MKLTVTMVPLIVCGQCESVHVTLLLHPYWAVNSQALQISCETKTLILHMHNWYSITIYWGENTFLSTKN